MSQTSSHSDQNQIQGTCFKPHVKLSFPLTITTYSLLWRPCRPWLPVADDVYTHPCTHCVLRSRWLERCSRTSKQWKNNVDSEILMLTTLSESLLLNMLILVLQKARVSSCQLLAHFWCLSFCGANLWQGELWGFVASSAAYQNCTEVSFWFSKKCAFYVRVEGKSILMRGISLHFLALIH